MAKAPGRRWMISLGLLAIAGIAAAWAFDGENAPARSAPAPAPLLERDDSADAGTAAPAEGSPPARAATSSGSHPPAPVSAAAPPGCPEDEPDTADFVRPSVWDALRLRTDELRERLPQISRDASPGLREGLNGMARNDDRALDGILTAPDRDRDGFDVAVSALLHTGMRALAADDLRTATRRASTAAREAPEDPLPHALSSLVADHAHDPATAREEIARAYSLAPDEPAFALAHARSQATAAHFSEALDAADAYLRAVPDDARTRRWRERLAVQEELTRGDARRSYAGIDVSWPRGSLNVPRVDEAIEVVRRTLDEVARLTDHARRSELAVVVYPDREAMRRATCTPSWTGAVFDGVLHLDAGTLSRADPSWQRVVRHESTHAQLARVEGHTPQWLNEGFAQWMEGPPSPGARRAWAHMVRDHYWIPFGSLEGGLLVIDDAGDAGLAYHQSLAMMLYLVDRRGEGGIREAVTQIEARHDEGLLEALVPGADGEHLLAFLATR